jgi:hypothetical protein
MRFIWKHLFWVTWSAIATAFLGSALVGMAGGGVRREMRQRAALEADLAALAADPKNAAVIAAAQRHVVDVNREYEQTLALAHRINARQPLEGVYPAGGGTTAALRFRDAYVQAVRDMTTQLGAQVPITENDVAQVLAELADDLRDRDSGPAPPMPGGLAQKPSEPLDWCIKTAPPRPEELVHRARQIALVRRARAARCYVFPDSFDVSPAINNDSPARETQMWWAQVGLWVQQDIVNGLAAANEAAAREIQTKGGTADVRAMPVKIMGWIRVAGYRLGNGRLWSAAGGASEITAPPPFHGRAPDDLIDVVPVSVCLLIDQRQLLAIADHIARTNFIRLINVEISANTELTVTDAMVLGDAPLEEVVLDLEVYFVRPFFDPLMPPAAGAALGRTDAPLALVHKGDGH